VGEAAMADDAMAVFVSAKDAEDSAGRLAVEGGAGGIAGSGVTAVPTIGDGPIGEATGSSRLGPATSSAAGVDEPMAAGVAGARFEAGAARATSAGLGGSAGVAGAFDAATAGDSTILSGSSSRVEPTGVRSTTA